jgi:hypothetical protein
MLLKHRAALTVHVDKLDEQRIHWAAHVARIHIQAVVAQRFPQIIAVADGTSRDLGKRLLF